MRTARIAIIGGGLSGLYAAFLLEQRGIADYVLIEARDTLGGRIVSVDVPMPRGADNARFDAAFNRFDLGPAWFWPGYQHELDKLIRQLGLERFEQYESGDMIVERSSSEPPVRTRGYAHSPPSMRLLGGMAALTDALRQRLDAKRLVLGHSARAIRRIDDHVEVVSDDALGSSAAWRAEHVLLALPPRLATTQIEFTPVLPASLSHQWMATPTWMAPHAKYVAVYDEPFWRRSGLSGAGRSAYGPLGEIHDASIPGASAALFGFFGIPALVRRDIPQDVMLGHCRAQLVSMFGDAAANPQAEFVMDWAQQMHLTATALDQQPPRSHPAAPENTARSGPWQGYITGIASEWSPQFPGLLAGAIEAAGIGVQALQLVFF